MNQQARQRDTQSEVLNQEEPPSSWHREAFWPPNVEVFHNGPKTCPLGVWWRHHYIVTSNKICQWWLIQPPGPSPSLKSGGKTESFKNLIMWLVLLVQFSSVQLLSHVQLFVIPWITAHQASLSITNSQSSLKLMSIELVMPSSHLIFCHPPLLLPPIPPSIRVFSNESTVCMRWPKYWSFSFSISPSNEHPGLISFRMDWLDLLAVQGVLKNLLQHHSSKASIFRSSAFFTVQLSHPYMTTGKTIALTRQPFVGKVMSLFFNMLSRLVIT